jgi:polysaccharide pyruvyl transferase CsaB
VQRVQKDEDLLMRKKIFLLGAYGQDNLGDEMILQVFLDHLREHDVTVNSANPRKTSAAFNVKAINTYGMDFPAKVNAVKDADVVVFGGGSLLKELNSRVGRWRHSVLVNTLLAVGAAKLLGKKVVMSAIGVGPLRSTPARMLAQQCARLADLITVRDANSKLLLGQLGLDGNATLVADPVFLLPGAQGRAGIGSARSSLRVGVAPVHNLENNVPYDAVIDNLAALCDHLIENHRADVTLIPFQTGFNPHHDLVTGAHIMKAMRHRPTVSQMNGGYHPDEMRRIIASLDLLVGMRLHSLVLAACQAVPFFALSYDAKTDNFVQEMQAQRYAARVGTTDARELIDSLDNVLASNQELAKAIANRLPVMKDRARLNFELLEDYLTSQASR